MRSIPTLILLAQAIATPSIASAANDEPASVAQTFYDAYLKVLNADGDARRFVMKSAHLTPALKKAYAAFMKDHDHDPIIQAQDFPAQGFQASPAKIQANTATVTITSRDASFAHSFKVTLVKTEGSWVISAVGNLRGK